MVTHRYGGWVEREPHERGVGDLRGQPGGGIAPRDLAQLEVRPRGSSATIIARTRGSSPRPGLVCIPMTRVQLPARASDRSASSQETTIIRSACGQQFGCRRG